MMTPTIDTIADDYAGRVKVGKLNVDENGGTGMRYRVQSIPTLLLFKGGQIVEHKVGVAGKTDLQKMLDSHVQASTQAQTEKPAVTHNNGTGSDTRSTTTEVQTEKPTVKI